MNETMRELKRLRFRIVEPRGFHENKMRKTLSLLVLFCGVLAFVGCTDENEDDIKTTDPVSYSCQYEIDFAKDVLSYADVAIAVKNPLTKQIQRDTLRSSQLSDGSFYSVDEYSNEGKSFVRCKMTWSDVSGSLEYGVYCNYLLNRDKVAEIPAGSVLQAKAAGLSVRCDNGGTSLFYTGGSAAIGSAVIETIVRIFEMSPDRFSRSLEGKFPQE